VNDVDPTELSYVFLISLDRSVKYKGRVMSDSQNKWVLEFTIQNRYDLKLLQEIEDES
jgi:hypothetical protein